MHVFDHQDALTPYIQMLKSNGKRIGFVPTMGALHDGHLSLVEYAKNQCDQVVVSIFVNPTQFAPGEDFDVYPRDTNRDVSLLKSIGVDCVYLPDVLDIYPNGPIITVKAGDAAKGLESDFRPHFFDGVCTVVHRLFEIAQPDIAVFGEKDYQQMMVIREMVETHHLKIDIVGAPIVRDSHGLALSSRNAYLNKDEMEIARCLNVVLKSGPSNAQTLLDVGFEKIDYIEERWGRILAAAWIGKTRLIDNCEIKE
ncbi:MAG: pantoate--beta-alanine ligase [Bdellovibrionales bacterium]